MRGDPLDNDPVAFEIAMDKFIGTASETKVKIVVRLGTN